MADEPAPDAEIYRGCRWSLGLWLQHTGHDPEVEELVKLERVEQYEERLWVCGKRLFEPGAFVPPAPNGRG